MESLPSGVAAADIVDTSDGDCQLSRQGKIEV